MTPNLTLVLVSGVLTASGVYLLLARSVVRALIGFLLMSNGVSVLYLIASGPPGEVPIVGEGSGGPVSDPIPQALVLTAIVITLGMTAFVLALAHRAWQLGRSDLVADDPESFRIHRRAEDDLDLDDDTSVDPTSADEPLREWKSATWDTGEPLEEWESVTTEPVPDEGAGEHGR